MNEAETKYDLARDLRTAETWAATFVTAKRWPLAIRRALVAEAALEALRAENARLRDDLYSARQALEAIHEGGLPCSS